MTKYNNLLIKRNELGVEFVTLNRPKNLNTLNIDLTFDLLNYFQELIDNDFKNLPNQPRIIVITGAGKHFCAGLDLASGMDANDNSSSSSVSDSFGTNLTSDVIGQRRLAQIIVRMRKCRQPIVGLLNGACAGGGFAIACGKIIIIFYNINNHNY